VTGISLTSTSRFANLLFHSSAAAAFASSKAICSSNSAACSNRDSDSSVPASSADAGTPSMRKYSGVSSSQMKAPRTVRLS